MVNFDRVLPVLAPVLGPVMRRTKAARQAQFDALPPAPGRVLFLGDSITERAMWDGWFPELPTTNRGISGDTIGEVKARLGSAIDAPLLVSLMIGTNDLSGLGTSRDIRAIAAQLSDLVDRIQEMAPSAPLLINSVAPRSAYFADRIRRLNDRYRQTAERVNATYVDLWPTMAAPDGALRAELTVEGIHFTNAGYRQWVEVLRPHLHAALAATEKSSE